MDHGCGGEAAAAVIQYRDGSCHSCWQRSLLFTCKGTPPWITAAGGEAAAAVIQSRDGSCLAFWQSRHRNNMVIWLFSINNH